MRSCFSQNETLTYFDTLRAPSELQPSFGRNPVKISDLIETVGLDVATIGQHIVDCDFSDLSLDDVLCSCSSVWPMGFS